MTSLLLVDAALFTVLV